MTNRFTLMSAGTLLALAATPACTTHQGPQNSSQRPATVTTDSPQDAHVQRADVSDDTFCRALRQSPIANPAAVGDSSDPATLLPALDALAAMTPSTIHYDFVTFDHLEHVLLDPSQPGATAPQIADPQAHDALTHIGAYLRTTCHITQ